ncbi:MAG: ATP-dependent zinc metalloprotease FtsH [Planctomycetes bacterium]|nr:ATP-dependent zinc metalloprotease FtsH [Planctomycetota bacterium]
MSIDGPNDKRNRSNPQGPKINQMAFWLLAFVGVMLFIYLLEPGALFGGNVEKINTSDLLKKIEAGQIKSLRIEESTGYATGSYYDSGKSKGEPTRFKTLLPERSSDKYLDLATSKGIDADYVTRGPMSVFLETWAPLLVVLFVIYFFFFRPMRGAGGGGILSFGKSRAVRFSKDKSRKTFDDVAGVDEARQEVMEIIEFLKHPEKFQRLGGRLPKGVLLIGPPGTGKTLLAKAIAGEADVQFFSISGSDFVEMFVGVGASRVRDLFEQSKQNSPCIIFLDEIDAVGRRRANDLPGSGVETAQTLNAILVEMDGFTSDDNVIVIAATNRPDVLDPALLRPGRFDRRIYVDLADIRGREQILKVHCKSVKISEDVDLTVVARGTPTFSGADLENLVNEAALIAVMKDKNAVDMECFEEARDKVKFGKEKRSRSMDEDDRRATAYHEAGHAVLMLEIPHVTPLHKVTIIPRGRALGATMQLPEKDEYNMGKKKILGEICVRLGGRVAEEIFLDDITNGASNDFQQSTSLARAMVCEWGMSDKLGYVSYPDNDGSNAYFETKEYSEATAEKIDNEVREILDQCYDRAKTVLEEKRDDVCLIVDALMEFESLTREEVDLLYESRNLDAIRGKRALSNRKNGNGNSEEPQKADEAESAEVTNDEGAAKAEVSPEEDGTEKADE